MLPASSAFYETEKLDPNITFKMTFTKNQTSSGRRFLLPFLTFVLKCHGGEFSQNKEFEASQRVRAWLIQRLAP